MVLLYMLWKIGLFYILHRENLFKTLANCCKIIDTYCKSLYFIINANNLKSNFKVFPFPYIICVNRIDIVNLNTVILSIQRMKLRILICKALHDTLISISTRSRSLTQNNRHPPIIKLRFINFV